MKYFLLVILYSAISLNICTQEKNSLDILMMPIPAGSFWMGSEGLGKDYDEAPVHKVYISTPFLMSQTEITNKQYEQFDPSHRELRGKAGFSKDDDEAVIFVSYDEATTFCKWLSKKEGKTYRLPTEAEWEYACRAGSYYKYWMGNDLPEKYQKKQQANRNPTPISLLVSQSPANRFGLHDMHGNVEEWCLDWYAPYSNHSVTDPIGSKDGLYRVTRGGSHNTTVQFLRSANRMAMISSDKHWLTGFRIVQAEYPATPFFSKSASLSDCMLRVKQEKYKWNTPSDKPFFKEPLVYVQSPDCNAEVPFYAHNHCPAITWCDNGDLFAIWFSADEESGREMVILGSRMRAGNDYWDKASLFFKVPDRNMTGSSLFHNTDGSLIHINGVEASGDWQNLAMIQRISTDNGATWTTPQLIAPEHTTRHQPISGMIKTQQGWLIQLADARPESDGGTAVHISKDEGKSWIDLGEGRVNAFHAEQTGTNIAGIHAGVVQLKNGNLLAFGRGDALLNKDSIQRMPISISTDMGKTWRYEASEFPPIDGGQRLALLRLNEGAILLISFTNHPFRIKDGLKGMQFANRNGQEYTGYGMYAAVSLDEGKTWKKKLLTDGKERFLNGGAWTGYFEMNANHAEPQGYLAVCQTPDNEVHLLSSSLHYRFNLKWLLANAVGFE